MKKSLVIIAGLALAGSLQMAFAGDVTGKVTLKGTPPPEKVNDHIASDPNCGKMHKEPVKTTFYVVGADSGLGNVFVYVKSGLPAGKTYEPKAPVVIDQKDCLYAPYVSGAMVGQKVTIKNSDPVMHNVHALGSANPEFNFAQPVQGQTNDKTFAKPEIFVKFKCDVHDWMYAYLGVVDHPFFAVTDKDGKFTITGLPPGKYTLEAKHLKAGATTQEITVDDKGGAANFTLEVPKPQ